MSKYIVDWAETKTTSTGKTYVQCVVKDEAGKEYENVKVWNDNPQVRNAKPGESLDGSLEYSEQYKSYTFKAAEGNLSRFGAKPSGIKAAQERKNEMINGAMDRKENGMVLAATFRDATLITLAQLGSMPFTEEEFKAKWQSWRYWLKENFGDPEDIKETKEPF